MLPILCTIFFLSGAAGLVFETLWFRQAGLAFGNSIWASSLVLASFMLGISLGNGIAARWGPRVRHPLLVYGGLELAIAVTGVLLVWVLPLLTPWIAPLLRPVLEQPWIVNPLRLAVAFLLLLIPSTAMGATLPLLVREIMRRDPNFGTALGRLYGWNTLGAVLGALVGEVALIAAFGVRGTAWCAAGMNVLAAAVAVTLSRSRAVRSLPPLPVVPPAAFDPSDRTRRTRILAAAAVSGCVLLALEVVWFRFLLLSFNTSSLTFSIMLATVLAGIALGGLIGSAWLRWRPTSFAHSANVALLAGVLLVAHYAGFRYAIAPYEGQLLHRAIDLAPLAVALMLPVALLSGLLFTFLGASLHEWVKPEIRAAGLVTLAATLGAAVGPLLAGFVLLPALGMERSLFALTLGYGIVAALVWRIGREPAPGWQPVAWALGGAYALTLLLFPFGLMKDHYFHTTLDRLSADTHSVVAVRETPSETILFLRSSFLGEPLYYRLATNGYSMSSTAVSARRYMKLYVYLPVALHPGLEKALLISYGVGSTAKALTDTKSLKSIDIVDISRDILEMSSMIYPDAEEHPLNDPRVHVHIEDGRYFLAATDERFDLITAEPPPPKAQGVVYLFTQEYFQLLRDRLNPGGFVTYWLPVHSMTANESKAVIRGFCQVFPDCTLWNGFALDWMLVGTNDARWRPTDAHFSAQWWDPDISPALKGLGFERPELMGALFLADPQMLHNLTRDTPPLVDNYPKRIDQGLIDTPRAYRKYAPLMLPRHTRERFSRWERTGSLWPSGMFQRSLPYFEVQRIINDISVGGYKQNRIWHNVSDLYAILAQSELEVIPLWMLLRVDHEAIYSDGRNAGSLPPEVEARIALARRDYKRAATLLRTAHPENPQDPGLLFARIFALCMDGRVEEAQRLLKNLPRHEREKNYPRYWKFMKETFGLVEPDAKTS
jgi:predicted membrane-bound spermidine synthase